MINKQSLGNFSKQFLGLFKCLLIGRKFRLEQENLLNLPLTITMNSWFLSFFFFFFFKFWSSVRYWFHPTSFELYVEVRLFLSSKKGPGRNEKLCLLQIWLLWQISSLILYMSHLQERPSKFLIFNFSKWSLPNETKSS